MIAPCNADAIPETVNPISRWEDDGGPARAALRATPCAGEAVNVGGTERALSALAGGSLLAYGLSRRSLSGLVTAIVGGGLVYRGMTGHCGLYDVLGISTANAASARQTCETELRTKQQRGANLSAGPVEYRSNATPPMHSAADESSVVTNQNAEMLIGPSPTTMTKIESERPALSESASPSIASESRAPERHSEHPSGAEPQGRT